MKALIIGGTGPTGPYIVAGLQNRGYKVTILHSGKHEYDFSEPVEHIHGDAHFIETLRKSLGQRTFDLVIASYGRLRYVVEVMKNRTARLISLGGGVVYLGGKYPEQNPEGLLMPTPETAPLVTNPDQYKFGYLMVKSEEAIMEAHEQGHFSATHFRFMLLYGPRQPRFIEWSIMRRILDGRGKIIIPNGGLTLGSRMYSENAAHSVMLAVDHPESGGQIYNMADEQVISMKEWIEIITEIMGHKWELIEMPWRIARPAIPYTHHIHHRVLDISKIKRELNYRDQVRKKEAFRRTINWRLQNLPEPGGVEEQQLKDPFNYKAEDMIIEEYLQSCNRILQIPFTIEAKRHPYAHPKRPSKSETN